MLETEGAVFSSCVCIGSGEPFLCLYAGSHDNHMYCWEMDNGESCLVLKWKCRLDSPVYSTCMIGIRDEPNVILSDSPSDNLLPFHSQLNCVGNGFVCVCSCKGFLYLIDSHNGTICCLLQLPNEVFSSPAIINDRIVVGCRDESLYCFMLVEN